MRFKTRVFFSEMSPQTFVSSENLTPFVFGGIKMSIILGMKYGYLEVKAAINSKSDSSF